jgi:hypothetical protein
MALFDTDDKGTCFTADLVVVNVLSTSGTSKKHKDEKLRVGGTYSLRVNSVGPTKGAKEMFQRNVKDLVAPSHESRTAKPKRTAPLPDPSVIDQAYLMKLFFGKDGEALEGQALVGALLQYSGRRNPGKNYTNKAFEALPRVEVVGCPDFFASVSTSVAKGLFGDFLDEAAIKKLRKKGTRVEDDSDDDSEEEDSDDDSSEDDSEEDSDDDSSEDDSEDDSSEDDSSEDDSEEDSDDDSSEDDSEDDSSEDDSEEDSDDDSTPPPKKRRRRKKKKKTRKKKR